MKQATNINPGNKKDEIFGTCIFGITNKIYSIVCEKPEIIKEYEGISFL